GRCSPGVHCDDLVASSELAPAPPGLRAGSAGPGVRRRGRWCDDLHRLCARDHPARGLMGRATERLAERLGEGIGGLLNATFGNAAELIIAIVALRAGLHDLVKASITGSIIGNILLVFGAS